MAADTVSERAANDAECRAFTRYLVGTDPTEYITNSYHRLLPSAGVPHETSAVLIERSLLAAGRAGSLPLRMADGYARFFRPRSLLRRRLILLLAIVENCEPNEGVLNSGAEGSLVSVGLRLMVSLVASGLCLIAGVILFGPLHLLSLANRPHALPPRAP